MKSTARLEAFSDGVFAIAITLLVLDLKVPAQSPLLAGLLAEWPVYLAYVISFLFILIMWVNHHWMLEHVVRNDSTFMLLNGLLLLGVTVLPFPTEVLAQYILTPDQTVAAVVYNGWFFMIGIFFNALWRYAAYNGRLLSQDEHATHLAQIISDRFRWGPLAYFLALALAFVWVPGALALNLGLAVFYAVPREFWARQRGLAEASGPGQAAGQ